jgi:putative AbiEii toxin of type IV toxin-antitoxin system
MNESVIPACGGIVFRDFVELFTIRLDGGTRLALTEPHSAGNRRQRARNHLWSLSQDPDTRNRLREMTYDAFGRYFVLDPTEMQVFRIKMSHTPPSDGVEDQLGPEAQEFFEQAEDIADLSDGIKAFTGLTAAVTGTDYKVMLIDEPEAFLHPTLAGKLGRNLTRLAKDRKGNVLAATHSPDFVMGCIEAGEANVVRLTYESKSKRATARHLRSDDLRQMMRDPLLRSTGVLGGLFHEGVVVGESDADRAVYQEVNQHLSEGKQAGAGNTLFLNAYEKSTVRRIVEPLRKMGIPAAAVVYLDIIEDRTFDNLVKSAFVLDSLVRTWGLHRSRIKEAFDTAGLEMNKAGIEGLPKGVRESARLLLDNMAVYGIFVVPVGNLERWFSQLQSRDDKPGSKNRWVPWVFELMNSNPELFEIEDNDVWGFVRKIAAWIANPEREGIPA